ncbi:MAG: 4-hydroxy-tetrahydrodipicolinate reductase [Bdellovibrionaceae bacterium]|nr:4-hydroxy-tetrahydrodipicolinate reductase [Pseudobdellovibrionaceae bacterium]
MSKKTRASLRIALVGAGGKMGEEIQRLAESAGVQVAAKIDVAKDWKKVSPGDVDMVVDFSSPEGLSEALKWCRANRKPLVSGSTGLSAKVHKDLKAAGKKIAILYSGNMSLGIAVFSAMMKSFEAIKDWDFQIEEAHHNQKKDRPSGTALLLQDKLVQVVGPGVPAPQSLRGGGIPGIHTLWAMGPEETLVVQHTAFNRQVFARGALRAALWLFDKKQAGLYDLSDLYTT